MKELNARSPKWGSEDKKSVELIIDLGEMRGIPFTARADDPEESGRKLFKKANEGVFGKVGEYSGPSKSELEAARFSRQKAEVAAQTESKIALLERARRLGSLSCEEEAELRALESYSVYLMRAKGPTLRKPEDLNFKDAQ